MHKQGNDLWADRYDRQIRFAPIGTAGQAKLAEAQALIVGCGALGASLAQHLTRAGVGKVRIVDRDFVEPSNLQRQVLFNEADALSMLPKAVAAADKLRAINGSIEIEALVMDVNHHNLAAPLEGADIVLDGTDNAATRLLLSEACFARGIPFIYGGVAGSQGMSAALVPGETCCLRCLIGEEADAEEGQNCDTAGVLSSSVEFVASLQAVEAVKWLSGNRDAIRKSWIAADLWTFSVRESALPGRSAGCPICGRVIAKRDMTSHEQMQAGKESEAGSSSASWCHTAAVALCGRDSVQVTLPVTFQLEKWRETFERLGYEYKANRYLLKVELPESERLVLFPDGRVLVQGVADPARALQLCSFYLTRP
ncbi:thiamine biosynthesis protein ThiF [Paenibacillus pinisoli]|uniref:Thiamine biosynthesis protein ThiF n=1 Tax=Paenibacillus pinisoli TaxID=1276110 RepID=A0A3A6PMZ8_9BACL|nr:ThiF family adenylyltransferase [Paenibacillus pinisoli]RJX37861.1 thiamine biosynthesis protein ThiF [Paenibacillus pinisoli]